MKKVFLSLLYLILSQPAFSNPIIESDSQLPVVKSSQSLTVKVGENYSLINGSFSYTEIPILNREYAGKMKDHFTIIVPVYVPIEIKIKDILDTVDISLSLREQKFRSQTFDRIVSSNPRGFEKISADGMLVYAIIFDIPIKHYDPNLKFDVSYKQFHAGKKKKRYFIYTPIFENAKVWEGLHKSPKDFVIHVIPEDGIKLIEMKGTFGIQKGNTFEYHPKPDQPIKLEILK